MNRTEILKLAEQAGIIMIDDRGVYGQPGGVYPGFREDAEVGDEVVAFAELLLAAERAPKPREGSATLAAIADVDAGAQVAPTARKHGIQPSTLFRALKRRREAAARPSEPTPSPDARRS